MEGVVCLYQCFNKKIKEVCLFIAQTHKKQLVFREEIRTSKLTQYVIQLNR